MQDFSSNKIFMQEKSLIKQNILKYLDFKGISKYKFYQESGITRGVLDQNNGMSEENITRFLAYGLDIDPTWLLTGRGNMLIEMDQLHEASKKFNLRTDRIETELQRIPLYNMEAAAGIVQLFSNQNSGQVIDYIQVPGIAKCDGAIYITGDSMYPLLKSGDIVIYKKVPDLHSTIFLWGEMYLISVDNDGEDFVVVKYVQKSEKGDDYIKLVSQNQHHDPIDVPKNKINALALVKASIRINSMK